MAMTSDSSMATGIGTPSSTASMAMTMPVRPIMEPIERSNSPPIISKATATARIPSSALTCR